MSQAGLWDNIANRLYYAAFHAVSALLISDGHPVGTHQGAVVMFHQYYIKTSILTKEDGAFYSQLQTLREKSNYNCTYYATEEDTAPRIALTETFINKVIGLIKDQYLSFYHRPKPHKTSLLQCFLSWSVSSAKMKQYRFYLPTKNVFSSIFPQKTTFPFSPIKKNTIFGADKLNGKLFNRN